MKTMLIQIEDNLHKAFVIKAATEGMKRKDAAIEAIKEWVAFE